MLYILWRTEEEKKCSQIRSMLIKYRSKLFLNYYIALALFLSLYM